MLAPTPYVWFENRPWLLALVLVVITFVAYQPAWHAGFIWDDDDHLTANPAVAASNGLQIIWSSLAVSRYYPLTLTSFWVERQLWGLNPLPYHLVNVGLHATNAVLIFFLLRRLRVRAAWLAAALWALHPVNVESVAWITELKNTQSGLFFFLTVLCFLRFESNTRRRWYILTLVCGLAALVSKPSTVVLPVALLLCVWWERGSWRRADILRVTPFFIMALAMSALTVIEQRGQIQSERTAEWSLGMATRLVIAGKAVWFYASKVLWPARLAFVYPLWKPDAASLLSWLPVAGLATGGALMWRWRQRSWARAGLFGCGFFVVSLLPVLGFFDVFYFRYSYVADHFQYLACVGLIALVVAAGATASQRASQRGRDLGTLAGAIVLLTLGLCTWWQSRIYHDSETLWADTLTKNPQCWMAHNNLGATLVSLGRLQEAQEHYEQSLQINSKNTEAYNNLGNVFLQEGKISDAIGCYEQALRIKPDFAGADCNLGNVLLHEDKISDAIGHYEHALRSKPDYAEAHYNLGLALARLGRLPEAVGHWKQALQSKPDYAEVHYALGMVLEQAGRAREAIGHYEQALRSKPDYAEAHNNLGNVLLHEDKVGDAIGHYEHALRSKPDYAEAHYNLGLALARLGRLPEAVGQWEQALQTKPDYAEVHYALGMALEQAGRAREAIGHYEQALRIKPDFTQAQNALTRLQTGQ